MNNTPPLLRSIWLHERSGQFPQHGRTVEHLFEARETDYLVTHSTALALASGDGARPVHWII
jgi:hypothetical protein